MIQIYTDTSANLPLSVIRERGLKILSFNYTFNGIPADYSEEMEFDGPWFYGLMRKGVEVKTSLISAGTYQEAFEKEIEAGNEVIYVGMSGGISGSANSAQIALREVLEEHPDAKVAAIDTYAASLGEGLQVLMAADMRDAGKTFDEIVEEINYQRHYMCQYFTVDDLMYLKKGGRISGASAVIGNILSIKPVLTGDAEGHIVLNDKVRGQKMAYKNLAAKYASLGRNKQETLGIAHADNEEGAKTLETMLRNHGFTGECITVQYEPVTGAHVGPGTVALFYFGTHK